MQEARPFFLLDWLDDLMVNQDAFQIAELLKTPSKLPRSYSHPAIHSNQQQQQHQLHSYSSDSQIAMIPTASTSSISMLRSVSSPQVSSYATPRSSNRKKSPNTEDATSGHNDRNNDHSHGILPTRLFHTDHPPQPSERPQHQPFKKRSMALGNGWNAKGLTKAKQGKWEAALACWDNALEIRLQISDPKCRKDQLEVANTWNNRGIALGKLGIYQQAIQALEQAYQIRLKLLPAGHAQIVSTLHNIANVHQQQGDLTTALQVFGNAKSLLVQSSTTLSTSASTTQNNADPMLLARICTAIGHVYYQAQQWIDSRDAYQDALNIMLKYPSSSAPSTITLEESPSSSSPSSGDTNEQQQQQREIYELERDIQELNAKISIANFHHAGPTSASSFFHGHRSPPPQSPQH